MTNPEHVHFDQELKRVFRELRNDPRLAARKAMRLVDIARAHYLFRGCALGHGVSAQGKVEVEHPKNMSFGNRVTFLGGMVPTRLICGPEGHLVIGDDVVVNYGASIEADQSVRIGSRSMLASFVRIGDRGRERVAPIIIGTHVWIAHGAIVEPGVTIGDGSVVSAGSVVTRDIPANMLAIGNPARAMTLDLMG